MTKTTRDELKSYLFQKYSISQQDAQDIADWCLSEIRDIIYPLRKTIIARNLNPKIEVWDDAELFRAIGETLKRSNTLGLEKKETEAA